ncbi:MAG TPA: SAM-dependent methyltransferase, partial [Firmicutes bacterium]|nr:SAM-dependent methyltransferase [Bacillota bacterium]
MNTSNNVVKEFFDKLAPSWDKEQNANKKSILSLLNRLEIKKGDDVLDLACGTGTITKILFNITKKQITAIDISSKMIEIAKSKYNKDVAMFLPIDYYDYQGKKFDWIIIYNSYPHFLDLGKFKEKLVDTLKDKGRVAIIHSLSRKELDSHHKVHALKVSRFLKP